MIKIPPERLPKETLHALVESFVLREGTDYGDGEYSLQDKLLQVLRQIDRGEIVITFDTVNETCNLLTAREWQTVQNQPEESE